MEIDDNSKETNLTPVTDANDTADQLLEEGSQIFGMSMLYVLQSKSVVKRGMSR